MLQFLAKKQSFICTDVVQKLPLSQSTVSQHLNAISLDYVITVCGNTKERCPYFPSQAIKFHYNFPDAAKATGREAEIVYQFRTVRNMIKDFCQNFIENYID